MHIETWRQLVSFMQAIIPILSPAHRKTAKMVIDWAQTHYGQRSGIDNEEKSGVIKFLTSIMGVIPARWDDEIREANMFVARLNTSPSATKWHTKSGCDLWKKFWWGSACHDDPEPFVIDCRSIRTQNGCVNNGCYWYSGLCHTDPEPPPVRCIDLTTQNTCLNNGCHWWDGACHEIPEPPGPIIYPPPPPPPAVLQCSDYETEAKCMLEGCYWYAGACHDAPEVQPPGITNPVREFAKQVNTYCATIPLTRPLELINCGILYAILNITADVFDFLGVKK